MVAGILDFRFRSFSLSARTDSSDPKFFLSSLRCRSVKMRRRSEIQLKYRVYMNLLVYYKMERYGVYGKFSQH